MTPFLSFASSACSSKLCHLMLQRSLRCLSSSPLSPSLSTHRDLRTIFNSRTRAAVQVTVRSHSSSRAARPMATAQPEWRAPPAPSDPVSARLPKLSVWNSLTRSKTPFVPLDPAGNRVTWYACGPTVYDDADYFHFDVAFVMNITDVDDKIILAARQQHLLAQFLAEHSTIDETLRQTTVQALAAYIGKNLPLMSQDTSPESYKDVAQQAYGHVVAGKSVANDGAPPGDKEAKVKMHLNTSRAAAEALTLADPTLAEFALKASGVLLPYIDSQKSSTVQGTDHEIFTKLTKHYEQRFFDDMKALNVRYPSKLVRVTEYGPQIVDFVKRIQDNGFGYEHEGSIYYDTTAWESSGGVYARLEPWNRNDKDLQADGEGSLAAKATGFKKSGADFALWKASKPGEPSWSSPWGEGRPGWHIECSAMASDVLGKQIDIHSGGIDLAFPHHDNELAQSEAYWATCGKDSVQWVNYFIHMGHLSIQGSKMSKSLKNFTTIREALAKQEWTPRSLRVVFLLGAWRDGLEITGELVKAGVAWEEKVNNFFLKVRDLQAHPSSRAQHTNGASSVSEVNLDEVLAASKTKLHDALCDSFDTPAVMRLLSDLITSYNSALHVPEATSLAIGEWITSIVVMFGLDADYRAGTLGWSGIDIPEKAKPFVIPLAALRDQVRAQAKAGIIDLAALGRFDEKDTRYDVTTQPYAAAYADFQRAILALHARAAAPKEYLAACDHVRDTALWNLAIYLEDREDRHALVRPLSAALRQERTDREALVAAKSAAKEKARLEAETAEREKLEKGKVSQKDLFRTSEYSAWDEEGLPTHDAEGKEVAKSKSKKLKKDWERQKKLHEAWLATQG